MNEKKAFDIIYTVCRYIDSKMPSGESMNSLAIKVMDIANKKCSHSNPHICWLSDQTDRPFYKCDDCGEAVKPVQFEIIK